VNDQSRVITGAAIGALAGAAVSYLFFTEGGRGVRDRIEPAVDDMLREFTRFRGTLEKVGGMANEGLRALQEFQTARSQTFPPGPHTSH
jgi:hypothetical protein